MLTPRPRCVPPAQYYFETLFPRIPKTSTDEIVKELEGMGLPTKAIGNAGQGDFFLFFFCGYK